MTYARSENPRARWIGFAKLASVWAAALLVPLAQAASGSSGTLERVREAGKITFGYRVDARPFSYRDESGGASGYSVALCQKVADQVKTELALPTLAVEWIPVTMEDRFHQVQQGKVDLLCASDSMTLERRKEVSFSIPIFPGGIGALLRADATPGLKDVLSGRLSSQVRWRGSPAKILEQQTFSVVAGTTSQSWLARRLEKLELSAKVVTVPSYEAGVRGVLDREANVFFAERAILLDAAKRSASAEDLVVLDRHFTYESTALGLARGDEDFRLLVDRTLSQFFETAAFAELYGRWFGTPDQSTLTFFQQSALPK